MDNPDIDAVHVAFLELAEPSIPDALSDCVRLGASEFIVFPYFLAAGTHVATDIPEAIAHFRQQFPQIVVTMRPHLGAAPALTQTILDVALPQAQNA